LVVVVVVLVVLHGRSRQQYPSLVESGIILLDGKNRRASESLRERRERQREESLKEREREREREKERDNREDRARVHTTIPPLQLSGARLDHPN
jgi:hypothetical protein